MSKVNPNSPNFNYPQDVKAAAQTSLDKALAAGDGSATVKALIEYGIAECMISPDSLPALIGKVEGVTSKEQDAATRAMLKLLTANLYNSYYKGNKWNINRRTTLLGETDITLWSGEQFRNKIMQEVGETFADSEALQHTPLTAYKGVIEYDENTLTYYPTLYDFASHQALTLMSELSETTHIMPLRSLNFIMSAPAIMPEVNKLALKIADDWVSFNQSKRAPFIEAVMARRQYLQSYCTIDDSDAEIFDSAVELYERYKANPYAIDIVLAANPDTEEQKVKKYELLTRFERFTPNYFAINNVKAFIAQLSMPDVRYTFPNQVAKNREFDIVVHARNINDFKLEIYRLKKIDNDYHANLKNVDGAPVAVIPVKANTGIPGFKTLTVKAKVPEYGIYIIVPVGNNLEKLSWFDLVRCSDLTVIGNALGTDMMGWIVNVDSGEPVEGAKVKYYGNLYDRKVVRVGKTDSLGAFIPQNSEASFAFAPELGADTYASPMTIWLNDIEKRTDLAAMLRTDLALYHPGDTVDFVTFAYSYNSDERKPLSAERLRVVLRDANNEPIDTLQVKTDAFGRATGSFTLPKEGLTGYFSLQTIYEDKTIGSSNFMVSDYKLPTYEVNIESVDVAKDGAKGVVIKGKAMTYSGFPLQGAKVAVTLSGIAGWYWHTNPILFANLDATTDGAGEFAINVTPELLEQSPYPKGLISADVLVTSATGENQGASTTFAIGRPYSITTALSDYVDAKANSRLAVSIINMVGDDVDGTVTLKFVPIKALNEQPDAADVKAAREIAAKVVNGACIADLSQLQSGTYQLIVTTPDYDAEPETVPTVVYNPTDNICPLPDRLFWMPVERAKVDTSAGKYTLKVLTSFDGQPAIMVVNTPDNVLSRKWVTMHKGLNEFTLDVPDKAGEITVSFIAVRNLKSEIAQFNLIVSEPKTQLNVSIESLRDKVTPGAQETVTVKITDGTGEGVPSALVLDMYCKALDAIAIQNWVFNPRSSYRQSIRNLDNCPTEASEYVSGRMRDFKPVEVIQPMFNFYGREAVFMGYLAPRFYSMRPQKSRMMMNAVTEDFDECIVECADIAPSPSFACGVDAVEEKEMSEPEAKTSKSDVEYRPAEVALGFFAPTLTVGSDGSLSYTFKVPNANTTWVLNALAISKILSTSFASVDIVSAKPVMIQPNMPRYIRQGDKVDVCVAVMNATDARADVTTEMELLDPADMKVISRQSVDNSVDGGASVTEVFSITEYPDIPALIVRVKSTSGNYTDAVQTLLPILPASQRVIDAETFYLTPDQKKFSMPMPKASHDAVTTVSFCENPTWEVVSALPGLRADNDGSSLGASAAIFSAAVASKVLDLNPEIKAHLSEWLSGNADDSSLLSMLNRNDDLKQMVLSSTPWVAQARNDAERVARLALLFKPGEISNAITANVDALDKLQGGDGGWKWTASSRESSLWVTLEILNNFAELRQLNCCPKELDDQVAKALAYVDARVAKVYKKYPGSTFEYYTYVRSLYPEVALKGDARKAFDATIAQMKKTWGDYGVCAKAAVALVLYRTGDKATPPKILSSIRQFATSTPQMGMWFDSIEHSTYFSLYANGQTAFILDAFNTIEPGCAEIDPLRQWLILNKTVQDWGTSVNTSAIVAAILNCGSNWLYKPGNVTLKVDGKKIDTSDIDKLTGRFVVEVPNAKGQLSIERGGKSPAWGAVLNSYTGVMTDIKAVSLPELSITKQMLVKQGDEWVDAATMQVGQVAKIRLIIDTKRDMDYLTIVDERAACMEPVIQTPRDVYSDGAYFYLENRDARTNLFIDRLTKGRYIIEYEMYVNNAGTYSSGVATIQSQYTPEMTAHTSGRALTVKPQ